MKLTSVLTIAAQPVQLIKAQARLDINAPGRARFEVVCEQRPEGIVELKLGYERGSWVSWFVGVVEAALPRAV